MLVFMDADRVGCTGDQDAEAVFGVERVVGEASQDVEQLWAHGLGVVENEEGVGATVGAVGGEVGMGLVEQVAAVVAHGQVERAVDGTQESCEGGSSV